MPRPTMMIVERDRECRATAVLEAANDIIARHQVTHENIVSITSGSVLMTVLENMKAGAEMEAVAESVDDLLAAYTLVLMRTFDEKNRN